MESDRFQASLQSIVDRLSKGTDANTLWKDVERRRNYKQRHKYTHRSNQLPPILTNSASAQERVLAILDHSAQFPPLKVVAEDAHRIESLVETGIIFCNVPTHCIVAEIEKAQELADQRNQHAMFEELPFEDSRLLVNLERELNRRNDQDELEERSLERQSLEVLFDGNFNSEEKKYATATATTTATMTTATTTTTTPTMTANQKYGNRRCLDLWSLILAGDCFALMHVLDHDYASHRDLNSADYRVPEGKSRTPLHVASANGDPHCTLGLLTRAAHVDAVDINGHTALDLAVLEGNRQCVELLLAFGAKSFDCVLPMKEGKRFTSCINIINRCKEYDDQKHNRNDDDDNDDDDDVNNIITVKGEEKHRQKYQKVMKANQPRIGQCYVGTWRVLKGGDDDEAKPYVRVPHTDANTNEFGMLWMTNSVLIGEFDAGYPLKGSEFRLADGQVVYHGNYEKGADIYDLRKEGQGRQILHIEAKVVVPPSLMMIKEKEEPRRDKKGYLIRKRTKKSDTSDVSLLIDHIDWMYPLRRDDVDVIYMYDGQFVDNLFHGKGTLFVRCCSCQDHSVGSKSSQAKQQAKRHGSPSIKNNQIENGQIWRPFYRGYFQNGTYEGSGVLFHMNFRTGKQKSNSIKYRGEFTQGKLTGKGTRYYNYEFDNKAANDEGISFYSSYSHPVYISQHEGLFLQGKPHGEGTSYYSGIPLKIYLRGNFQHGRSHGVNTKIYKIDGETLLYSGKTQSGKLHGTGTRRWEKMIGLQQLNHNKKKTNNNNNNNNNNNIDIVTYEGEFNHGVPHGQGKVFTQNGTIVGIFENGVLNRPILLHEWNQTSIFYQVAVGGVELQKMLNTKTGFDAIMMARTCHVLGLKTSLHVAVESGNLGSIMTLISSGACDPKRKDYLCRTALDVAILFQKPKAKELLELLEIAHKSKRK